MESQPNKSVWEVFDASHEMGHTIQYWQYRGGLTGATGAAGRAARGIRRPAPRSSCRRCRGPGRAAAAAAAGEEYF